MSFINFDNGNLIKILKWIGSIITALIVIATGLAQLWNYAEPHYRSAKNMFRGTEQDVILMKHEQTEQSEDLDEMNKKLDEILRRLDDDN